MIGIKTKVITTEKRSPNITANASGTHREPANTKGIIPITVVMVVRRIGRSLLDEASITISLMSF